MPLYAYQCSDCGHAFDRLQRLSDPDPVICPACGAHSIKRQLTAPSFRLSGSGWYETDFKKDSDKKRNLAEGGEGAKPSVDADKTTAPASSQTQSGDSKPSETKPTTAKPTPAAPTKTETKPAKE